MNNKEALPKWVLVLNTAKSEERDGGWLEGVVWLKHYEIRSLLIGPLGISCDCCATLMLSSLISPFFPFRAAFQYGIKMSEGRKTRRFKETNDKAELDRQWKKISAVSGTDSGWEGLSWEDILAHRLRNQARAWRAMEVGESSALDFRWA